MKTNAAIHAAFLDLRKQVEELDLPALIARLEKLEGREKKVEANAHATELWQQAISHELAKVVNILFRLDVLMHGLVSSAPLEKPTPRER